MRGTILEGSMGSLHKGHSGVTPTLSKMQVQQNTWPHGVQALSQRGSKQSGHFSVDFDGLLECLEPDSGEETFWLWYLRIAKLKEMCYQLENQFSFQLTLVRLEKQGYSKIKKAKITKKTQSIMTR